MATRQVKYGAWTKDELKFVKGPGRNMSRYELARELGRTLDAVKKKCSRLGIGQTKAYLKKRGKK